MQTRIEIIDNHDGSWFVGEIDMWNDKYCWSQYFTEKDILSIAHINDYKDLRKDDRFFDNLLFASNLRRGLTIFHV